MMKKNNNGRARPLSTAPSSTVRWNPSERNSRIYKTHAAMGMHGVCGPTSRNNLDIPRI